jgi:predicted DNA-binding antitoxin AbrB/MazE fold protein
MVRQTVDAVYENGVLRPLTPLTGVPEHGAVRITVTGAIATGAAQRPLADCVGILPDADAQEMRSAIEREFEGVNPNEWK